ncbi:MAG: peptidoglycan DD-metalloendopeptidase family protein [Oscillospiraceae bacterium]|nr:peptidoglycan DD-metalloendopeptidase family protein [Oscillospiraceae bacterium]
MFEAVIKLILRASLTAGIAAAVVMLLRLPLKKAPKRWSYLLWAVVFFRCLCPFSVESAVSIFNAVPEQNITAETEQTADAYQHITVDYDPVYVDYSGNAEWGKTDTDKQTAVSQKPVSYNVLFIVWVSGVSAMLLYAVVSYIRLMGKMKTAVIRSYGIYETDRISTAFSAGLFPPKIFLPEGLSEKERRLIIAHERVHIKRLDFITKPLAFAGLALHWFNPMIWVSFVFMTRDMELSCDEAVLKILGRSEKKSYSEALLKVSMKRSGLTALPLAFAGTGIKERVKNVLGYKKSGIIATVIAAVVVLTAGVVLGTDAVRNSDASGMNPETRISADNSFWDDYAAVTNSSGEMLFIQYRSTKDTDAAGLKNLAVYDCNDGGMVFENRGSGKRDIDIDNVDPEKIEKVIIQDLRTGHYDENDFEDVENGDFTYIAVDMELYMTEDNDKAPKAEYSGEYIENNTVITKMCGGNEHLYGMYFEIEIAPSTFESTSGYDIIGYGIELVGFGDAEIYVADKLKIADFNFPVVEAHDDTDDTFKVDQDASNWGKNREEEQRRLEEERRREEQERQKRLAEEQKAMEQEKDFLYYSFSDDDGVVSKGYVSRSDVDGSGVVINSSFSDEIFASEVSVESTVLTFENPDAVLRYPIEDPENTVIAEIDTYGNKDNLYFNKGINFPVPEGTPVYAAADGRIINGVDKENGYGICVIIDHGDDLMTLYAHLSEALVQDGDVVKAGDLIGYAGSTGAVYGTTLHFEVRVGGQHTDPMDFLEKID